MVPGQQANVLVTGHYEDSLRITQTNVLCTIHISVKLVFAKSTSLTIEVNKMKGPTCYNRR